MRLDLCTWPEVQAYLQRASGILLATGSIEQHGPMGLIGTDALCAQAIAQGAAERTDALVAPPLAYAPAPFNMAFPGTVSLTPALFREMAAQVIDGLSSHGFAHIYVVNGHGANLEPLRTLCDTRPGLRVRSWWDFEPVNALRDDFYGDWEGMHATPSEIAITQALHRVVPAGTAADPPRKLSRAFIQAHAGDRHGPPDAHRRDFPDGRVGSHSALATPEHGQRLLDAAIEAVAEDYRAFIGASTAL